MCKNNEIIPVFISQVLQLPDRWPEDQPQYYFRSGIVTRHPPEYFLPAINFLIAGNGQKYYDQSCIDLAGTSAASPVPGRWTPVVFPIRQSHSASAIRITHPNFTKSVAFFWTLYHLIGAQWIRWHRISLLHCILA